MTTKHQPATPLPWTLDHECLSANGQHIAMAIGTDGATYQEQKQNAQYVAHSANAYPELVAALRKHVEYALAYPGNAAVIHAQAAELLRNLGELDA